MVFYQLIQNKRRICSRIMQFKLTTFKQLAHTHIYIYIYIYTMYISYNCINILILHEIGTPLYPYS